MAAERRATLQREVSYPPRDEALAGLVDEIDHHVNDAYRAVVGNPDDPAHDIDGYSALWLKRWKEYQAARQAQKWYDVSLLYRSFGYVVESLATGQIEQRLSLPPSWAVSRQVTHSHTRPDIVISDDVGRERLWVDITSSASALHILRKQHSTWRDKGPTNVAEVTYPSLDLERLGLVSPSPELRFNSLSWQAQALTVEEKLSERAEVIAAVLERFRSGALFAQAGQRRYYEERIGALFPSKLKGKATPYLAKGVIVEVLGAGRLRDFGYKGKHGTGLDRAGARRLLYDGINRVVASDQDRYNYWVAHAAKAVNYVGGLPLMENGKLPEGLARPFDWQKAIAAGMVVIALSTYATLRALGYV